MARQLTIHDVAQQPMRQPPFRSAIVISLRRLAGVMRVPPEHTSEHAELVRCFGELSWNEEHFFEIVDLLYRSSDFNQPLARELILDASRETLPKGANRSLGCMDCNETGWKPISYRSGYSGVVRCDCVNDRQQELAIA